MLVNDPRTARVTIPLPTVDELRTALELLAPANPVALADYASSLEPLAAALAGSTLGAVENLLKLKEYRRTPIRAADLVGLKKELVEREGGWAHRVRGAAPHAGRFPRIGGDEGLAA